MLFQDELGELVFLPYTAFLAFFFVFLYKTLPETKGKTFEEITALFSNDMNVVAPSNESLGLDGKYSSFTGSDSNPSPARESESNLQ